MNETIETNYKNNNEVVLKNLADKLKNQTRISIVLGVLALLSLYGNINQFLNNKPSNTQNNQTNQANQTSQNSQNIANSQPNSSLNSSTILSKIEKKCVTNFTLNLTNVVTAQKSKPTSEVNDFPKKSQVNSENQKYITDNNALKFNPQTSCVEITNKNKYPVTVEAYTYESFDPKTLFGRCTKGACLYSNVQPEQTITIPVTSNDKFFSAYLTNTEEANSGATLTVKTGAFE